MGLRTFWRSYRFALQRILIDSRSRNLVFRVCFFGLYVVVWFVIFGIVIPFSSAEGAAWHYGFTAFVLGTGFAAFLILRRVRQRDAELLNCSITGEERPRAEVSVLSDSVRTYLAERAHILSSLGLRAAAEILGNPAQNPDHNDGVMRQIQNGLLRQRQLWTRLEHTEADLMSAPERTWTEDQQNEVAIWCEQLRVLRWVVGLDAELAPLAHFPHPDFRLAAHLPEASALASSTAWLNSWDVRVERDAALVYGARVIAELDARNLIVCSSPEVATWVNHVRESSRGDSVDMLAGAQTVGTLSDADLMLFACITAARERYATYLIEQLTAKDPRSFAMWAELRTAAQVSRAVSAEKSSIRLKCSSSDP